MERGNNLKENGEKEGERDSENEREKNVEEESGVGRERMKK